MLALGLILILLSAGALVAVIASGADEQAVLYGGSLEMPTLVVFLAGALALLLFVMGLQLVLAGVRHASSNRQAKKRLRKLEKREELRRESRADGATGDPETGEPSTAEVGDTAGSSGGRTSADDPVPAPAQHTVESPTAHGGEAPGGAHARTEPGPGTRSTERTDGPYQTPPPPTR